MQLLESDPYSPPTNSPINSEILNLLAEEGQVVKVSESVVFSTKAYQHMVDKISSYICENGNITVANVRDIFKTSRKYALALVDHMDQQQITRRIGDARVLR